MGLNLDEKGAATGTAAGQQDETVANGNAGMDDLMGLHGPSTPAQPQVPINLFTPFQLSCSCSDASLGL